MGRVAEREGSENEDDENPESWQDYGIRCRHDTRAPDSVPAGVGRSEDFRSGVDRA